MATSVGNPYFFTVVVPVYNAEKHVLEALESIAKQSYGDFEAIVIDDGSTDTSAAIVKEFCQRDSRFRFIHKEHQGVCATRDLGISHARGSWIAVCDADDAWHQDKLSRQIAFLKASPGKYSEPIIALGTCGYRINLRGKVIDKFEPCGMHTEQAFLRLREHHQVIYMLNSSVIFRKDIFEQVGGYRADYDVGQDVELWTRMAPYGLILNLPDILTFYRMHGSSASDRKFVRQMINTRRAAENAKRRARGEVELTYEEFVELLKRDAESYQRSMRLWTSRAYYRNAGSALTNGQYLRGLWLLARSFLVSPGVPLSRLKKQVSAKNLFLRPRYVQLTIDKHHEPKEVLGDRR